MHTKPAALDTIIPSHHTCYVAGGISVTLDRCMHLNGQVRNRDLCVGCSSPRRVCTACQAQRIENDSMWVKNPATGLCAWHTTHGAQAIRTTTSENELKKLTAVPAPPLNITPAPKQYPGKRRSRIMPEHFDVAVYENTISAVQKHVEKHWHALCRPEKELLQSYVRGLNSVEASAELHMSSSSISLLNRKLAELMHVPDEETGDPVRKGQLRRWILMQACKRYLSGEKI